MHRKDFISSLGALGLSNLFNTRTNSNSIRSWYNKNNGPLTLPQKKQVDWQAAELGMIFHYDISIFGDRNKGNNGYKGRYDPITYIKQETFFSFFITQKHNFDAEQCKIQVWIHRRLSEICWPITFQTFSNE